MTDKRPNQMTTLIKSHRFRGTNADRLMCSVCGEYFGKHSLFPDKD